MLRFRGGENDRLGLQHQAPPQGDLVLTDVAIDRLSEPGLARLMRYDSDVHRSGWLGYGLIPG